MSAQKIPPTKHRFFITTMLAALTFTMSSALLAATPPMGWMSWEVFRCEVNCTAKPEACVNEALYRAQGDALVAGGYAAVGYDTIHIDDCWQQKTPPRDASGKLVADPARFPNGIDGLSGYMHNNSIKLGIYTAESTQTCGKYPGSENNEKTDADTFAAWGVDYLKADGCGSDSYYPKGYPAMGDALVAGERDIVFSCEWAASFGHNESAKPFDQFAAAHCNLWRNYRDIQCNWGSLADVIEHWGNYSEVLANASGPGRWNDPDMLLIGNTCITDDEARSQMAIWSISAAPLIMGNDLRTVPETHREILLNSEVIAVNQDALGKQGIRSVWNADGGQVWNRELVYGTAFVLYNPTEAALNVTITFTAEKKVRDLWVRVDLGSFKEFTAVIPSHGAGIYTAL